MFKRAKSNLKSNKGFTLIELIVVIAIIGILMVLAVPRLLGYTEDARQQSDEQLATLYRNTFDVLIGSGKLKADGAVTVSVSEKGVAKITGDLLCRKSDGTYDKAVASGNKDWKDDAITLEAIQSRYINRGGRGGDVAPAFQSKKFIDDKGILIKITSDGIVTVADGTGTGGTGGTDGTEDEGED